MKEQQNRRVQLHQGGGSMGCKWNLQNITVESSFNYSASQLPSKLVAIVADNAEARSIWRDCITDTQKLVLPLKWVDKLRTMVKSWMLQKYAVAGNRCSKSTKWTTTSYCWSSCPSYLEPRIHLGYWYQSSSSCHEEPHSTHLLHAWPSQYHLVTTQPKQDLSTR